MKTLRVNRSLGDNPLITTHIVCHDNGTMFKVQQELTTVTDGSSRTAKRLVETVLGRVKWEELPIETSMARLVNDFSRTRGFVSRRECWLHHIEAAKNHRAVSLAPQFRHAESVKRTTIRFIGGVKDARKVSIPVGSQT